MIMERLIETGMNAAHAAVVTIVGGILTGAWWLIRRVVTNQKEIALLKQHLETRDEQRAEDRQAMSEVRESVKRIEGWIMEKAK